MKITKATFKSFIKKNSGNLFIKNESAFDCYTDCIEHKEKAVFRKVSETNYNDNTLGLKGVWLVGSSNDYFNDYNDGQFKGIECYNCCGSFIIAIKC
jgi:hypothetical protein